MITKRAQMEGFTWFFAIISIMVILILFYFGSLAIGERKKVSLTNEEITQKYYERVESLWSLSSFLFFNETNVSREVIYNFFKLKGYTLSPPNLASSPLNPGSGLGVSTAGEDAAKIGGLMIQYLAGYLGIYQMNDLYCYMLIIGEEYTGKSCVDSVIRSDSFFLFDSSSLKDSTYLLKINGQLIGIKMKGVYDA